MTPSQPRRDASLGRSASPYRRPRGPAVNLHDARLCVDCEAIYSFSHRCPRCGSFDSDLLGSAFDPALPAAATEVWDPVRLLRARRAIRQARGHEYSTLPTFDARKRHASCSVFHRAGVDASRGIS